MAHLRPLRGNYPAMGLFHSHGALAPESQRIMAQRKRNTKRPRRSPATKAETTKAGKSPKIPAKVEDLMATIFGLSALPEPTVQTAFLEAIDRHLAEVNSKLADDPMLVGTKAQLEAARGHFATLRAAVQQAQGQQIVQALGKSKGLLDNLGAGFRCVLSVVSDEESGGLKVVVGFGSAGRAKRSGGGAARQTVGGSYSVAGIGSFNSFSSAAKAVSQAENPSGNHSHNGWRVWKRISDGVTPGDLRGQGVTDFSGTYEYMGRTLTVG